MPDMEQMGDEGSAHRIPVRGRERFMQALLQHAPDVISILDPDGVIIYESPAAERAFGLPVSALIGTNALEYVHPDDLTRVAENFRKVIEHPGASAPIVFRLHHEDGSWRWFEVVHNNCLDDAAVAGIVVNLRDITDRIEVQEQLRATTATLRALVEASPFAVIASDVEDTIQVWNPAAERLWQWSRGEALGRNVVSLAGARGAELEMLSRAVLEGEVQTRAQLRHRRGDGTSVEVEVAAAPMRDTSGTVRGIVWFAEDVTDRNRIVARVREQQEMELAITRLEGQLAQAQLQVLQTQLHPHFMFNTLNSIAALMHRDLAEADTMLTRLADLLRLALRRSTAERVTLRDELSFLEVYLEIEQARYGERLRVEMEVDPAALLIAVPHLILQPMVENALRHGIGPRRGPGVIGIRGWIADEMLHLEVRDDGRGLPRDWSERRMGLGITNTRRRLEQMYGADHTFEIRSAPEGGVVAQLVFPALPASE